MITVDEQLMTWREGMTLADLLAPMEDGDHCAVVKLNDRLVSRPDFATTAIPDKARIRLIPLVAGG
jgi:thiamine biosynthesis protein ThiS